MRASLQNPGGAFHIQIQKPKIKIQSIAMNDVASKKSPLCDGFAAER